MEPLQKKISIKSMNQLFADIRATGAIIIAPVRSASRVLFEEVESYETVAVDAPLSTVSAKEIFFPRYEEILRYRTEGKKVAITALPEDARLRVLFGIRPCDARSIEVLDRVFTSDHIDPFVKQRREQTVLVTIGCEQFDENCFCTSVGSGPHDRHASDILLRNAGDTYHVEVLTDKGARIIGMAPILFSDLNPDAPVIAAPSSAPEPKFDPEAVRKKLDSIFDSPVWEEQSLRCTSCGACAFVCSTCTCFDMQDEKRGSCGSRIRCWDSCGFDLFTLHTSGHNPRESQAQRWRQRIMHKFTYQADQVGLTGCVGCGRCSRVCPNDMNILEHIIDCAGERK